jgi:hypothetical protein
MKKNIFFYLALLTSSFIIFFLFNTCNTTEPDELKPGRRDYTWTVDTLKVPEGRSIPYSMWGANENDVWAVGLSYLNAYCIWHFDGNSWSNYTPDKYINPTCIWGAAYNDIWIGSSDGAFWHYDGIKWNKFFETVIPNYQQFIIQSMYGSSPSNIYAVGFADSIGGNTYKAIVMHFNGSKWELVNTPNIKNSFDQIFYNKNSGKFIISGWIFNQSDEFIYSFDGSNLNQILSSNNGLYLSHIGDEIIVLVNSTKIYNIKNNATEILIDFSSTNIAGFAQGRNEKDIITSNYDGIGHYNGADLITIYPKWNTELNRIGTIIYESDLFYIWEDSYNTFVVHGKLSNQRRVE